MYKGLLLDMLYRHLVTLFLILLFTIKLWTGKKFRGMETRYFFLTVISCFILVIEDVLEVFASVDPAFRFWRTLLSVIGYTFRSVAPLGLLLVIVPQKKRRFLLWIPALITLFVCSTAFFTDIAFGFDEDYGFYRGPLGYVAFIVPLIYLLLILWNTFNYVSEKQGAERYIGPVSDVFCLAATIVDAYIGGIRLNEAIMISGIFFYILLYGYDNRKDPLTGLLNRSAFYDDCKKSAQRIKAVVSIDMNGLKELNDMQGHQAGDEALTAIGASLHEIEDQDTRTYRIGGDEFVILFFHDKEEKIAGCVKQLKESVEKKGYRVSAGYAMVSGDVDLEEAIRISDKRMYEDKSKYYLESGKDRRRR